MGIAGMILGVIAVVFALIPFVGVFVAIPCSLVGLPLSVVRFYLNRKAGTSSGMAITGIATNLVGLILAIVMLAIYSVVFSFS